MATCSRIASPWSARLSTSVSTSASTTAPPTPPSHLAFGDDHNDDESNLLDGSATIHDKQQQHVDQLPSLHLLNMSCDDALSDISDEPDGFFSLDMDVSIDRQLQQPHSPTQPFRSLPQAPSKQRFDSLTQRNACHHSASPLLNPAVRRASETVAYSSSPLQAVGLDPIMASRSRNSPALKPVNTDTAANASSTNLDTANGSPPSSFGPIAPEIDQKGNLEYKLKILPPSRERFDRLVTQLKWRLLEGGGLAVYEIGVLDDGTLIGLDPDSMKDSLKLLSLMAAEVGANCHVQRVLALEKLVPTSNGHVPTIDNATPPRSSSHSASTESDLSLRALSPTEAIETLQPYILTAPDLDGDVRTQLIDSGSAGLYRFDIAEQQLPIPPPLATDLKADASSATVSALVAAVDPTDSAALTSLTQDDAAMAMSAQTKRRLLKSTMGGLPPTTIRPPKKDVLQGRDQSAIVYLPSKQEKRILRAAEAEHEAAQAAIAAAAQQDAADRALSHTEAQERKMMAKMTRVADSVQPKTARARAKAHKMAPNALSATGPVASESPSPTPSPAIKPVNASPCLAASAAGAYAGYENVMSTLGVLSERAARCLYQHDQIQSTTAELGPRARLIVEAVVTSEGRCEHN